MMSRQKWQAAWREAARYLAITAMLAAYLCTVALALLTINDTRYGDKRARLQPSRRMVSPAMGRWVIAPADLFPTASMPTPPAPVAPRAGQHRPPPPAAQATADPSLPAVTRSPGAFANDAAIGTQAWQHPHHVAAVDEAFALLPGTGQPYISHYLVLSNFGFCLPAGATIAGIRVMFHGRYTSPLAPEFHSKAVRLVRADGTLGNINKVPAPQQRLSKDRFEDRAAEDRGCRPGGSKALSETDRVRRPKTSSHDKIKRDRTETVNTNAHGAMNAWSLHWDLLQFGGERDLWGESLTVDDVNDPDFGVALSLEYLPAGGPPPGTLELDHVSMTVYYAAHGRRGMRAGK
jgi:hypothetical protein